MLYIPLKYVCGSALPLDLLGSNQDRQFWLILVINNKERVVSNIKVLVNVNKPLCKKIHTVNEAGEKLEVGEKLPNLFIMWSVGANSVKRV